MSHSIVHRPWAQTQPPSEAAIRRIFAAEGLWPYRWANAPHDVYAAHAHDYHKVIYCVEGAISFGLPETGTEVLLRAGDRLELPAGVRHDARVGADGVVCLEAHRAAAGE